MNDIDRGFVDCFIRVDKSIIPRPISITKSDFSFDIMVENAFIGPSTRRLLSEYFGGISVKCEQIFSTQNVCVSLSRINLPNDGYKLGQVVKYIHENRSKGFFLGIGQFGPIHLSLRQFTHMAIFGTSGFGKSVMFKGLLSHTLAFEEKTINYMIDFKKVDFVGLNRHPAFKGLATDTNEAITMISALNVELAYREMVFSESFAVPPVNLPEYWDLKQKYKRDDIPDFPRIMVWIDEARLFFDCSDDIQSFMMPLMRKGRAFGIHFIYSTQRPNDIPTSVSSQVPERMWFFLNSNSDTTLNMDSLDREFGEFRAIRGRFRYFNSIDGEGFEGQAPYLSAEQSLGLAFYYRKNCEYDGLSKILLPSEWMANLRIPMAMVNGVSLKSIFNPSLDYRPSGYVYSRNRSGKFEGYFPMLSIAEPADEEAEQESDGNDDSQANGKTKNEALEGLVPQKLVLLGQKLGEFKKIDNNTNTDELVKEFENLLLNAKIDFNWAFRDLSKNSGLLKMYAELRGVADLNNLKLKISELALDQKALDALLGWTSEVRSSIEKSGNAPILLLSSFPGYGKKTILETLARELGIPWRKYMQSDLLNGSDESNSIPEELKNDNSESGEGKSEDKAIKQKTKEVAEKPKKEPVLICFDSLTTAVQFSRHRVDGQPAICIFDLEHLRNPFVDPVDILISEVRSSSEPLVHLHIPTDYYTEKYLGDKLVRTLAAARSYTGDLEALSISTFAKAGLEVIPSLLANVIDRASKTAFLRQVPFTLSIIEQILAEIQTKSFAQKSDAVTFIKPEKSLSDLMVNQVCYDQVQEAITRSLTFDQQQFQFAKKLRRADKLVCLFWGPPGTGKSLSGEVIAKQSNRDLWLADIGKMQSAYVGETEKIMTKIFESAKAADVVLQLDECDSFLINRSAGSSDYRISVANHLLNLIESYSGILILTTNFADKIDPAFARRIDMIVEFQRPDLDTQVRILQGMLQPDAPLAKDIDLRKALEGLKLTGGLIRNAMEKLVVKMSMRGLKVIEQDLLREVLVETSKADKAISDPDVRRAGI